MTNKHTPGPWKHVVKYGDNSGPINGPDGKAVASIVGNSTRPTEEKGANARLIAAAPELLEVARSAAAIGYHGMPEGEGPCRCSRCDLVREASATIAKATGGPS